MQRINWVPKSDPQTPAASRKEGYSTSLIRSGDSVSVPKTLHNQIVKLQSKHPKTALALDVLVIELSKLFPEWKGRKGQHFTFAKDGGKVCIVIEFNRRPLGVRIPLSEVSHKIASQLKKLTDGGRPWGSRKIGTVDDAIDFVRLLKTEISPQSSTTAFEEAESSEITHPALAQIGVPYVDVDENVRITPPDAFTPDPSVIERGWRGHRVTQNRLAAHVRSIGAILFPPDGKPVYDLAWKLGKQVFLAEIKSVTDANEEWQMRLGLGQVLHYAHQLSKRLGGVKIVPVLVPEREPSDPEWKKLCAQLGVILTWPDDFVNALRADEPESVVTRFENKTTHTLSTA